MVNLTILAGGYDVFIATYVFSTEPFGLSLASKWTTGQNPSWITGHPTNKSLVYAVNEIDVGAVQAFVVDPQGKLSAPLSTVPSGGSPAHVVALSTGEVAVSNYGGGTARFIPTSPSGDVFIDTAPVLTFPLITNVSHPHMALEFDNEIFVPDLGGDTIWRLGSEGTPGNYKIQGSLPQPSGSGPRHIAISDDRLFALHELASTLTVQKIPQSPTCNSTIIASASIIPSNPPAGAKYAAAEILIPKLSSRFSTPYIYVSNRNVGTTDESGDSIAIFEHVNKGRKDEGLKLIKQVFTGLNQIRGMEFGGPDNEYLIASGVVGTGGVLVLRRTDEGRNLEIVARNTDIPTRTTFIWL
ncbi:hypothetical protein AMATHDRAFT_142050 [Amanita thiersii Skay4041]|uniref:Isomerase YbhE n=1 Tax=Amanita thiersii Skay4041 TaxID=703135 RepID=A0A2A9NKX0_9AGAR|nr:hypothetical protein AMATHDRAFT_142050 [Amanita thiersii Skay4041]